MLIPKVVTPSSAMVEMSRRLIGVAVCMVLLCASDLEMPINNPVQILTHNSRHTK